MNPDAIIETYVGDVVAHLPRKQRKDVGYELRSLLTEELHGRAADAGRAPDAEMTVELLTAFGRPIDVADRYRPAGFTIIRPADARRFAVVAFTGVALQWVLTLIATYTAPVDLSLPGGDWLSRLGTWWLSWGLGSFWWPGFLVTMYLIGGAITARREARGGSGEWRPRRASDIDRDRVHRPVMVLYIALGVVGASVVIALPMLAILAPNLPEPVLAAFAFDPEFLAWRAPWVLLLWAASLWLGIALLAAGRWTRLTWQITIALDAAWIALLVWWVAAGPIFVTESADSTTKLCLIVLIAITVLDLVLTVRRVTAAIAAPAI
ncbi:hypothetical protein PYV02_14035 [Leifsonia sp. H3M29-4]|uniref:hypothetical protein n=1 Tax=Salinibacterium metalliresistens TaxID=3031321 RepID=UPI0023DB460B|nr:hypothetical protein [Salinibacterium metalliresistens]MDF1480204.1 hypothetical protein [Salinibacterium metalliresistens]